MTKFGSPKAIKDTAVKRQERPWGPNGQINTNQVRINHVTFYR
jgi:hypothetical protein